VRSRCCLETSREKREHLSYVVDIVAAICILPPVPIVARLVLSVSVSKQGSEQIIPV